jgi:subtilisin family serine protease
MSNNPRRPILFNGEVYSSPVEKRNVGGAIEYPLTYDEARTQVIDGIRTTREYLRQMPQGSRLPNEVVMCIRMQPKFSAKSYYPDSLFDLNKTRFGLQEIGSRNWRGETIENNENQVIPSKPDKLFFVRTTERGLTRFEQELNKSEYGVSKGFIEDIRKVSSLDLLSSAEQILGLSNDWSNGRLEAVLHPFSIDRDVALQHFLDHIGKVGADISQVKYKQYGGGVTFISFDGNIELIQSLRGYNPLRTLHPLEVRGLPSIERGLSATGGPLPPIFKQKSSIVVGVIDGGAVPGNPYLDNYIEIVNSVSGPVDDMCLEHGMQVSGAVLYGPLNKYSSKDVLPEPAVSVKSFRVLSANPEYDPELYEIIDAIEDIIPANEGKISVYNLSLGPAGPVLDDSISRFTFACDLLSKQYNVLFCVAVGNDGEKEGYNRIQSPSDMVNGLAVGAYTKIDGIKGRASYSCIGPGREGNKMKPDLLAFGGCGQNPIHLVGPVVGGRVWNAGTSFASPIVAGAAGRLIGESNKAIDALIARTLLIHSSIEADTDIHSVDLGHGFLPDDLDKITTCQDKSYTLIYKGELEPGKYAEFAIPWENEIEDGKVSFHWTVAVLTDVDHQSPDDYTSSSVEMVFYANRSKYTFSKGGKNKVVDISVDSKKAQDLLDDGWKQSNFPASDSSPARYRNEDELRADLKWDSLDTRVIRKKAVGVKDPIFHIHAISRGNRVNQSKVKFALILTVHAPDAKVDLYSRVLNRFSALVPLTLNAQSTVPVTVGG